MLHGLSRYASSSREGHLFLEQVVRIACEVEHLECWLTLPEATSQLAAGHLRHHHVRDQDVQPVDFAATSNASSPSPAIAVL